MMERLHNCPNCGAILDDTGRCNFCGSKVYDLCDINLSGKGKAVTYLRIKTDKGLIIAPIICNKAQYTSEPRHSDYIADYDGLGNSLFSHYQRQTITLGCEVVGEVIYEKESEEK